MKCVMCNSNKKQDLICNPCKMSLKGMGNKNNLSHNDKAKLNQLKSKQTGKGFFDDIVDDLDQVFNPITKVKNLYTFASNILDGEKPVPQITSKSGFIPTLRFDTAFSGPGTNITKKLDQNKQPISFQDKVAKRHDLDYSFAKDYKDIRKADNKMKDSLLGNLSIFNPINSVNNLVGYVGIASKNIGEDIGLFGKESFTKTGGIQNLSQREQNLYKNELDKLNQEGFGKKRKKGKK